MSKYLKRLLTVTLSATMVLTSVNAEVFAAGTDMGTDPVQMETVGIVAEDAVVADQAAQIDEGASDTDTVSLDADEVKQEPEGVITDEGEGSHVSVTFTLDPDVKSVTCVEHRAEDGMPEEPVTLDKDFPEWRVGKDDRITVPLSVKKGNSVTITEVNCGVYNSVDLFRIMSGDGDIIATGAYDAVKVEVGESDEKLVYDLGVINEECAFTVKTARFPSANFICDTDEKTDETGGAQIEILGGLEEEEIVEEGETVKYASAKWYASDTPFNMYGFHDGDDIHTLVRARTINTSTKQHYKIKNPIKYKVEDGSEGEIRFSVNKGTYDHYSEVPKSAVIEAAFARRKLTVTAELEPDGGYRKQLIEPDFGDDAEMFVRQNGDPLMPQEYSGSGVSEKHIWAAYGRDAAVTVKPKMGYSLEKVCYVSKEAKKAKEKEIGDAYLETHGSAISADDLATAIYEWVTGAPAPDEVTVVTPGEDGNAKFTIEKISAWQYVYAVTEPDYVFYVNGEATVATCAAISVAYNAGSLTDIMVYKGAQPQEFGDGSITYSAAVFGDVPEEEYDDFDVSDLLSTSTDNTHLYFDPDNTKVFDQRVTIPLKRAAKANDPGFEFTVFVDVTGPITTALVDFNEDAKTNGVTNVLGTQTVIPLDTSDEYVPGSVEAYVYYGETYLPVEAHVSEDGKSVIVESYVRSRSVEDVQTLIDADDLKIKLYDKNDDTKIISEVDLDVTADQVSGADLTVITAKAGSDIITVDLSRVELAAPLADGLYYHITAETDKDDIELKKSVSALVPAYAKRYDIELANSYETYEPVSVAYAVKVDLVQVVTSYIGESPVEADIAVRPAEAKRFAANVSTLSNGTYPTKIKLKKNKKLPEKLFDTDDEWYLLGTVKYSPISGKKYPTVQRVLKVMVDVGSYEDNAGADFDGNAIYINPKYLAGSHGGAGKHTITVYAVEPKGREVTCSYTVNVVSGIRRILIDAPESIYKPAGKKAEVKVTAALSAAETGDTKVKPAVKKVKWSLCGYKVNAHGDKECSWEPLDKPGIKIDKKGLVTIDKKLAIPDEGLYFYVCAEAADHAKNTAKAAELISVHASSEAPAHICFENVYTGKNRMEITNGGKLPTSELDGSQVLKAYDSNMDPIEDVKFEVKGLVKVTIAELGKDCWLAGKPTGKVTVTAKKTDGSGLSKKVTFSLSRPSGISVDIYTARDYYHLDYESPWEKPGTYEVINQFSKESALVLSVSAGEGGLISHSVSVKGGSCKKMKIISSYQEYRITPTASVTAIMVKDKATGKKINLKIKNVLFDAAGKKLSVTASKKKIINYLRYEDDGYDYEQDGCINKVTYTVKSGGKPVTGKVMISTKSTELVGLLADGRSRADFEVYNINEHEFLTDLADGKFTIDYAGYGHADRLFYIPKGTYSFTVTPVTQTEVDGENLWVASGKTAKVKVKAAAAPKASVVMKKTAFKNFGSQDDLAFKKTKNIAPGSAKFTGEVLGANSKGKISRFAKLFATKYDPGIPGSADNKLTCIGVPDDKEAKGISGWVQYEWRNLDGGTGSKWVKVTVTPKKKGVITKFVPPVPDPIP